jgi:hypothetical protein
MPLSAATVSMRTAADASVRSPFEPRCAGQPLIPSLARGVGSSCHTAVRRSAPPAPCPAGPHPSLVRDVGNNRAARVARLGRTAAPADSDWFEPYAAAVGVGNSTAGSAGRPFFVGR